MNKHRSYKNNKSILIGGLLAVVVIMAVGYAAFASSLKISGTSNISTTWDVEITDITTSNKVGSASVKEQPTFEKLTATFSTNLVSPGDSITYNIKVENKGSLDAKLNKITLTKEDNPAVLFETKGLKEGGVLRKGESAILNVSVTYNSEITSQPTKLDASLTATLDFAQSDGTSDIPIGPTGDTAAEMLKAKVVTSGDGLYTDSTEAGRYVYRGANPNNYITLGTDTYRIISVESDGTLKVIKNGSIGIKVFDPGYLTSITGVTGSNSTDGTRYSSTSTDYCYATSASSYYGCKTWGSKTTTLDTNGKNVTQMPLEVNGTLKDLPEKEAYLNTYLNNDWYNSLSSNVQNIVVSHMFNVGATKYDETNLSNTITQEQTYKWKGKVGLMNPSDYVKASTNSECTSVNAYYNVSSCYNNSDTHNWIYAGPAAKSFSWTIAPCPTFYASPVFRGYSDGRLSNSNASASGSNGAAPVLYLSSDISLGGDGTSNSPYTVG